MTRSIEASLSFNEIEALAAKAARGAGLGWGQAEDLGRGARWLAEHGADWTAPLLGLLGDAGAAARMTGIVMASDRASTAVPGERWVSQDSEPVFLVPLLAASIYGRTTALTLLWPGTTMRLTLDGAVNLDGAFVGFGQDRVRCAIEATAPSPAPTSTIARVARPAAISRAAYDALAAYAAKTTVPASAASRALGAGSTRSDND